MRSYVFYSDAGHGWLKVARKEVEKLGILNQISSCSYQRGDYLYLEEDCDAGLFIRTLEEKGIEFKFVEKITKTWSRIRDYEPFAL